MALKCLVTFELGEPSMVDISCSQVNIQFLMLAIRDASGAVR
jgi:hypothetical protein